MFGHLFRSGTPWAWALDAYWRPVCFGAACASARRPHAWRFCPASSAQSLTPGLTSTPISRPPNPRQASPTLRRQEPGPSPRSPPPPAPHPQVRLGGMGAPGSQQPLTSTALRFFPPASRFTPAAPLRNGLSLPHLLSRPAAPRYDLRTLVQVTFGIAAAAAALVTGGLAAVTHLDAKIDAKIDATNNKIDTTNNKIDNKIEATNVKIDASTKDTNARFDATNNKIDALGAEVRSSFSALREDMRRRDDRLEQMLGTTRVLEGDVGRLMDAALGRQQQQQRREPPPSAGDE